MFRRKKQPVPFDRENLRPAIRSSICTGERAAGFQNIHTGKFSDVMLVRDDRDLAEFLDTYGLSREEIAEIY